MSYRGRLAASVKVKDQREVWRKSSPNRQMRWTNFPCCLAGQAGRRAAGRVKGQGQVVERTSMGFPRFAKTLMAEGKEVKKTRGPWKGF